METRKNYFDVLDKWLDTRLRLVNNATENTDDVINLVKDDIKAKIRESYFNGRDNRTPEKGGLVKEAIRQIKPKPSEHS